MQISDQGTICTVTVITCVIPFDFLICSERSGSNLITKIMDAHPDVCGPFPSHILSYFSRNLYRYGDLASEESWSCLLEDVAFFLKNGQALWMSKIPLEQLRERVRGRSLADIFRVVYEHEVEANGKKRAFVKENWAYDFIGFMLSHFDKAKYVYLVRDPRDMALWWKESNARGQAQSGARQWKTDQKNSIEVYGYLRDIGKILLVKFEDLITGTEEQARRICCFLGLEYCPQMLRFHEKDVVKENAKRITSWSDLQNPIIKDNTNRYKAGLSEDEIRYIEGLCGEEMDFFGYATDFPLDTSLEVLEGRLPEEDLSSRLSATERQVHASFGVARKRIEERCLYRRGR